MAHNPVGGYSDMKHATAEIQKYCDQVKNQVQANTNKQFKQFKAELFRSQVVQGTMYLIKIHGGHNCYIHVKLWHKLPCDGGAIVLSGVQEHHTKDDPLKPF